MSVILLTKGPISSYNAIHQNGPVPVRKLVKSQFLRAASALEAANLGHVVQVMLGFKNHVQDIFIKRLPEEITEALKENGDLCNIGDYTARFYMPTPKCIHQRLRDELVLQGHVKEEHFDQPTYGPVSVVTHF